MPYQNGSGRPDFVLGWSASSAFAQDASIAGTITDDTKAVLPGATVTATNLATGVLSVAVSDAQGQYRLVDVPPGKYRVQADLSGFSSVIVPSLGLLIGQNAALPFSMKLASLSETVTVSSESPLVDVSSSQVAGNVHPRQMEELPLQGRNWLELSKLVKGITANEVGNGPGVDADMFQLNLDGQQVTQKISNGFGQPKFSRESIGEFQIITNLFDITQGRSAGVQVQAISRSGTNRSQGSFYGFFRHDQLNASDPITHTVLPYSKLDLRITKDIALGATAKLSLIGEVYNLLNHANYGGYVTQLNATSAATTARFGQPSSAQIPPQGQLAFRLAF